MGQRKKLSEIKIAEICKLYESGKYTFKKLSEKFSINPKTISIYLKEKGYTAKSRKELASKFTIEDYLYKKYGRLTIIEEGYLNETGERIVLCQCSCYKKTKKYIRLNSLKRRNTQSCGCLASELSKKRATKHKLCKHPIYRIWYNIKNICYNKKSEKYKNYGGKGIVICNEWLNDFQCFYDWCIVNGWKKGICFSLKDSKKLFSPQNCYFLPIKDIVNKESRREKIEKTHHQRNFLDNILKRTVYSKEQYEEKHPLFCKIEEIMDDPNGYGILVKCKKCDQWFKPGKNKIMSRIQAIEKQNGLEENNFYCSDKCKRECLLFNLRSDPFGNKKNNNFTNNELQIFREEVKNRQKENNGYNFCEKCEKTNQTLYVHHVIPKSKEWIYALDPDNGIILCKKCHLEIGHNEECSIGELIKRKKRCNK